MHRPRAHEQSADSSRQAFGKSDSVSDCWSDAERLSRKDKMTGPIGWREAESGASAAAARCIHTNALRISSANEASARGPALRTAIHDSTSTCADSNMQAVSTRRTGGPSSPSHSAS